MISNLVEIKFTPCLMLNGYADIIREIRTYVATACVPVPLPIFLRNCTVGLFLVIYTTECRLDDRKAESRRGELLAHDRTNGSLLRSYKIIFKVKISSYVTVREAY